MPGFPFDEDVMHGKSKLKDHLEDLAKRHPEFADQLKDWSFEKSPKIPRAGSGQEGLSSWKEQKPQSPGDGESCSTAQGPSKPQNLRNTVPDMQAQQDKIDQQQRNQRSQSAPPEGPPAKGNPQFADPSSAPHPAANDVGGQSTEQHHPNLNSGGHPHQPQQQVRGNERYIPIFVEGRGETIVNVPSQNDKGQTQTPPPRQKKLFKTPSNQAAGTPQQRPPSPPPAPSPGPAPAPSHDSIPPQQPPPQAAQTPPPTQPPRPPSPLTLVANIQKEVEELKHRVDAFKGSKTDKEYIYLDEMLTRNLLKLDNIDSEGRDEVRAARKEVIKLIQLCINILETPVHNNSSNA